MESCPPSETSPFPPILENVTGAPAVDAVINGICRKIADGVFGAGSRLPTETELADMLSVGRNSAREAIKILVAMGVLEIRRADGTFVAERFSGKMLAPALYAVVWSGGDANALLELRRLLETGELRIAAERRTESDLEALEGDLRALSHAVAEGDRVRIARADSRFHQRIRLMGGNELVERIGGIVDAFLAPFHVRAIRASVERDGGEAMMARHTAMYRVVAEGDASAAHIIGDELFALLERMDA